MEIEKANILLRHQAILSDELKFEINQYLDFCESQKPVVKIISGDERLKSKANEVFASSEQIFVESFSTANSTIEHKEILNADYYIIYTGAMRMAPLQLTELLNKLKSLNKTVFVVIDKWEMLPRTHENYKKVKTNAIREFSMLNIQSIFMIGDDEGFLPLNKTVSAVINCITKRFEETRRLQIDKLFSYYLKILDEDYLRIKNRANSIITKLEEQNSNLMGIHNANVIKFNNINAELTMYSKTIFDKINLISAEEIIEEEDYDNFGELRKKISNKYVELVMQYFDGITEQILTIYQTKTINYRDTVLNGMLKMHEQLSKLDYVDKKLVDDFYEKIIELKPVDEIVENIQKILQEEMGLLQKKIKVVTKTIFDEESLSDKLMSRIQKVLKDIGKDDIEKEEENIKRYAIIRSHFDEIIDSCNLKIFSETDLFVNEIKKTVGKHSANIVDSYFKKLEALIVKMETEIERKYIVK